MIVFDNNAIIYCTEPQAEPKFQDIQKRLLYYLRQLQDEGIPVIVPTTVLFEYLCKFDVTAHRDVIGLLEQNFIIYNPGSEVAGVAAELFRARITCRSDPEAAG